MLSARCCLRVLVLAFSGIGTLAFAQLDSTFFDAIDHPAIQYSTRPVSDQVAELNGRLASGDTRLRFEPGTGYLRSCEIWTCNGGCSGIPAAI